MRESQLPLTAFERAYSEVTLTEKLEQAHDALLDASMHLLDAEDELQLDGDTEGAAELEGVYRDLGRVLQRLRAAKVHP